MILGVGTDLCDIRRIEKAVARFGARFVQRLYTEGEQRRAERHSDRPRLYAATLAKRFAAKEAVAKALGTGFDEGVYWRDLEVVTQPSGQPTLRLTGGAAARFQALVPAGWTGRVHLGMTDEYPLAQAQVVLSADPPMPDGAAP
jgi:holo-[acyl-carrier protein] synthase